MVRASFAPPVLDADLLATRVAFWSLVNGRPDMDAACVRLVAIGIAALVDGLWLELCLDPTTFAPEEARAMTRAWIAHWIGR